MTFFERDVALNYLQAYLTHNKARGMVAELAFEQHIKTLGALPKFFGGGWIVSPKVEMAFQYRYIIFNLHTIYKDSNSLKEAIAHVENDRGFQSLATFLSQSGVGIIVSASQATEIIPEKLVWYNFVYQKEHLQPCQDNLPFDSWPSGRGRAN